MEATNQGKLAKKRARLAELRAQRSLARSKSPDTPKQSQTPRQTRGTSELQTPSTRVSTPSEIISAKRARLQELRLQRSTPRGGSAASPASPLRLSKRSDVSTDAHSRLRDQLAAVEDQLAQLKTEKANLATAVELADLKNNKYEEIISSFTASSAGEKVAGDDGDAVSALKAQLDEAQQAQQVSRTQVANLREEVALSDMQSRKATEALEDANDKMTQIQGELTQYWASLMEEGADLAQVNETQRQQQETIEDYEVLLNESYAELEELRGQSKHQAEIQGTLDDCLETYEKENQRLLAELEQKTADLTSRAHSAPGAGSKGIALAAHELPDAVTLDDLQSQLQSARDGEEQAAARADKVAADLEDSRMVAAEYQERVQTVQSLLEAAEDQIKDTTLEKEAALNDLRHAVGEIEAEESRLHNEIDLYKMTLASKEMEFRSAARSLEAELEALREDKDALSEEIAELKAQTGRRGSTTSAASPGRPTPSQGSLQSELAALNQDVPLGDGTAMAEEIALLKEEGVKLKREGRAAKAKMKQLEGDLKDKSQLLDQVIVKWKEAVDSFIEPPKWDQESRSRSATPPAQPQAEQSKPQPAQKNRRRAGWSKFLSRKK